MPIDENTEAALRISLPNDNTVSSANPRCKFPHPCSFRIQLSESVVSALQENKSGFQDAESVRDRPPIILEDVPRQKRVAVFACGLNQVKPVVR